MGTLVTSNLPSRALQLACLVAHHRADGITSGELRLKCQESGLYGERDSFKTDLSKLVGQGIITKDEKTRSTVRRGRKNVSLYRLSDEGQKQLLEVFRAYANVRYQSRL